MCAVKYSMKVMIDVMLCDNCDSSKKTKKFIRFLLIPLRQLPVPICKLLLRIIRGDLTT